MPEINSCGFGNKEDSRHSYSPKAFRMNINPEQHDGRQQIKISCSPLSILMKAIKIS